MKTKTMVILCMLLPGVTVLSLIFIARRQGIKLNLIMGLFIFVFLIPQLLMAGLAKLEGRLPAWRKAEGDDVKMYETSNDVYGLRHLWKAASSLPTASRLKLWMARTALSVSLGLYLAPLFAPDSVRSWIDIGGVVVLATGLLSSYLLKTDLRKDEADEVNEIVS